MATMIISKGRYTLRKKGESIDEHVERHFVQNWINAKLVDIAYSFTEDYCMNGELNYFLLEYFKKENEV